LAAWPSEAEHLRKIGRVEQADKLEANLEKLRTLTEAEKGKGRMARKKVRSNGDGDVYPRKNKQGKVTSYRGAYVGPDGKRRYVSGRTKEGARKALREAAQTVTSDSYLRRVR